MKTRHTLLASLSLVAAARTAVASPVSTHLMGAWRAGDVAVTAPGVPAGTATAKVSTEVTVVNPSATPATALVVALDAAGQLVWCGQAALAARGTAVLAVEAAGAGGALAVLSAKTQGALVTPGTPLLGFAEDRTITRSGGDAALGGTATFNGKTDVTGTTKGGVAGALAAVINAGMYGAATLAADTSEAGALGGTVKSQDTSKGTLTATTALTGLLSGLYAGVHMEGVATLGSVITDIIESAASQVPYYDQVKGVFDTAKEVLQGGSSAGELAKQGESMLNGQCTDEFKCTATSEAGAFNGSLSASGSTNGGIAMASSGTVNLQGGAYGGSGKASGTVAFDDQATSTGTVSGPATSKVSVQGKVTAPINLNANLVTALSGTTKGNLVLGGSVTMNVVSLANARAPLTGLPEGFDPALLAQAATFCGM